MWGFHPILRPPVSCTNCSKLVIRTLSTTTSRPSCRNGKYLYCSNIVPFQSVFLNVKCPLWPYLTHNPIRAHHSSSPLFQGRTSSRLFDTIPIEIPSLRGLLANGYSRSLSTSHCFFAGLSPRGAERGRSRLVRRQSKPEQRRIKSKVVLVVDENGENLGEMATEMAMQLAEARGLEIVQVQRESAGSKAVCKFLSKKQIYDEKKQQKLQNKKDPRQIVKEIPISTKISTHDMDVKLNHVQQFLEKKFSVRVVIEANFRKYFSESEIETEKKLQLNLMKQVEKKLEGLGSKVGKDSLRGRKLTCTFRSLID